MHWSSGSSAPSATYVPMIARSMRTTSGGLPAATEVRNPCAIEVGLGEVERDVRVLLGEDVVAGVGDLVRGAFAARLAQGAGSQP